MTVPAALLVAELKAARRGRGLYHPDIDSRVGPALREVCGIRDADAAPDVRAKVISRLREAAATLPAELSLAAQVALGIHPDVRDRLQLQQRVDWLAEQLRRDTRTARRRIDEACALLAENAVAGLAVVARGPGPGGWYVESYYAALMLDSGPPVVLERRVVVAERDGIDQLGIPWSLPPAGGGSHDILTQVVYGGVLMSKERVTVSRFRLVLALPVTLRSGQRHEYAMLLRVPPHQPMRPYYVYTPASRCDHFDLRVRFDHRNPPPRVWNVVDSFHRDLDEMPYGDTVPVDRAGEVHVQFDDVAPGYGYGIRWE